MRLDKNLTSQQLWTIATDREHRTADLLDQIVDHPATYRALSDWAVAALGEQDVRAVDAPPAPDADAAEPRRGLRLPTMPLGRRAAKPPASEPEVEPPAPEPEASETDAYAWLSADPIVEGDPDALALREVAQARKMARAQEAPAPQRRRATAPRQQSGRVRHATPRRSKGDVLAGMNHRQRQITGGQRTQPRTTRRTRSQGAR